MGLKGDTGDGGVRSYQVPSKVQGEGQGRHVTGDMGGAWGWTEVHGGVWGCMGHYHHLTLTCPSSSSTWQRFYMKEGKLQRHDHAKVMVCYGRQTAKFSAIISDSEIGSSVL